MALHSATMPLVSVIMPTLNGHRFIASSIGTLQSQDHDALDVIVIDNGSTDDTVEIVERLATDDPRIRLARAEVRGIASARNVGLAVARGEFIGFLDHDDLCPPGKIARQLAHLSDNPATIAVFGRTVMFPSTENVAVAEVIDAAAPVLTISLAAALFRRRAFNLIGPLDPFFKLADDFDFILRLIEAGLDIAVEDEVATLHRRHPAQATSDFAATRRELALALAISVKRRRRAGNLAPLAHPLVEALRR